MSGKRLMFGRKGSPGSLVHLDDELSMVLDQVRPVFVTKRQAKLIVADYWLRTASKGLSFWSRFRFAAEVFFRLLYPAKVRGDLREPR